MKGSSKSLSKDKASGDSRKSQELKKQKTSSSRNEMDIDVKSQALKDFANVPVEKLMDIPANAETRRFNENDIVGNLDRDEKGNVIPREGHDGKFFDKDGKPTNARGYLVDPKSGDVVNNVNGQKMFRVEDMDEKGEVPAPFNFEKHNFNPHQIMGDFDFDVQGDPVIKKNSKGLLFDKRGNRVSPDGYRIDTQGNVVDCFERKKFDSAQVPGGELPKLFSFNGRRYDMRDIIGACDKDAHGNIIPRTD